MDIFTTIGALIGTVAGTGGLVLGVLNYLRDQPAVHVKLTYGMKVFPVIPGEEEEEHGYVTITNSGRRPVFVSHVHLIGPPPVTLLLRESLAGEKLGEGEKPLMYPFKHSDLHGNLPEKMIASVIDSTGSVYRSRRFPLRWRLKQWSTKKYQDEDSLDATRPQSDPG